MDEGQTDNEHGISIHAPREGGDWHLINFRTAITIFQSTPPARGATWRYR